MGLKKLILYISLLPVTSLWAATDYNGNILGKGITLSSTSSSEFIRSVSSTPHGGALDQTFGGGATGALPGTQFINFSVSNQTTLNQVNDVISAITMQPDGKIVAVGITGNFAGGPTNPTYIFVARFLSNGQLDTSFGGGATGAQPGTQFINFSICGETVAANIYDSPGAVQIQSDGKIVVAGTTRKNTGGAATYVAVVRFLPNGQLDTTFGGGATGAQPGTQFINFSIADFVGTFDSSDCSVLGSDGKIYVGVTTQNVGATISRFAVACFLPNGQLDMSFGQTQTARAGTAYANFSISNQTNFVNRLDIASAILLQPDGSIVVGGWSGQGTYPCYFALARFLPSGSLDTTFGQTGTAQAGSQYIPYCICDTTAVANDIADQPHALALQPDSKIIIGGTSNNRTNSYYALARFSAVGQLDTTFGGGATGAQLGTQYVNFSISNGAGAADYISGIALQPTNKILATGYTSNGFAVPFYFSCAQFLADGQLDTTFGATTGNPGISSLHPGTAYLNFSISAIAPINDGPNALTLQPDGKIIIAGGSSDDTNSPSYNALARLTNIFNLDYYQSEYPTQGGFY